MSKPKLTMPMAQAVTRVTMRDVFFTSLLYELSIVPDENLSVRGMNTIIATNGVSIIYNPQLFDCRTLDDRVFMILHEIMHGVMNHFTRRGHRDPALWNIAGDLLINAALKRYFEDHGMHMPTDALYSSEFDGDMTTEFVYSILEKAQNEHGGSGSGGGSDGDQMEAAKEILSEVDLEKISDIIEGEQTSKQAAAEFEREMAVRVKKAQQVAKAYGGQSNPLTRIIDAANVERVPWHDVLSKYMTAMKASTFNWDRIDYRRLTFCNALMPERKSQSLGTIMVALDCSGSISSTELDAMAAHLTDIARECAPEVLRVVYFDSEITHHEDFTGPLYDIELSPIGGGSTDFRVVAEYAEEISDASVALVFTDMYGPFSEDCAVPTVWVSSNTHTQPPYGDVIVADFND